MERAIAVVLCILLGLVCAIIATACMWLVVSALQGGERMTVPELLALSHEEAQVYIDALPDEEKIALREEVVDWLLDELKFVLVHGERRSKE